MTSATVDNPNVHLEHPDLIGRRWRTGVRLLIFADASFVAALLFASMLSGSSLSVLLFRLLNFDDADLCLRRAGGGCGENYPQRFGKAIIGCERSA